MSSKSTERYLKFSDIATPTELTTYLDDVSDRLKNRTYLYHYTTLSKVIAIFKSKCWHLCNARDMNDMVEYNNGDKERWKNLFFASFMSDAKESIGMWSMYSQPWEKGVKIALPINVVKKWINDCTEIFEVSPSTFQLTGRKISINSDVTIRLSSVVYSNTASLESASAREELYWSNQTNSNIKQAAKIPDLTGYIKDKAWDYEKEVRLKAEFNNIEGYDRVAIALPDEIANAMIISAGPLFEGDLLEEINKEIKQDFQIDQSLFAGKLHIKSICKDCAYKKKQLIS